MKIIYKQCPRCESKDTLKILYGMPSREIFESGKYWIGGCCILIDEDGEILDPEYHCKSCGYEWSKKQAIDDWYRSIEVLKVSIGSCFVKTAKVVIDFKGSNIQWGPVFPNEELKNKKDLSKKDIDMILRELITSDFLKWKAKYINEEILDGTQWEIEYIMKNKLRKIHGSNDYPNGWSKFTCLLEGLTGLEV